MTNQERLQRRLDLYLAAEEKILLNQSYTIGQRTYTRANLKEVQDMIASLSELLEDVPAASRIKHAVIIDN